MRAKRIAAIVMSVFMVLSLLPRPCLRQRYLLWKGRLRSTEMQLLEQLSVLI